MQKSGDFLYDTNTTSIFPLHFINWPEKEKSQFLIPSINREKGVKKLEEKTKNMTLNCSWWDKLFIILFFPQLFSDRKHSTVFVNLLFEELHLGVKIYKSIWKHQPEADLNLAWLTETLHSKGPAGITTDVISWETTGIQLSAWSICTPDMKVWKGVVHTYTGHPGLLQALHPNFSNIHLMLWKMKKLGQTCSWSHFLDYKVKIRCLKEMGQYWELRCLVSSFISALFPFLPQAKVRKLCTALPLCSAPALPSSAVFSLSSLHLAAAVGYHTLSYPA